MNPFGVNLSFAIKRWPEPERWTTLVQGLGVDVVQYTFDFLDPWWPQAVEIAQDVRRISEDAGIRIHSVTLGLGKYTGNALLHPDPRVRSAAAEWWRRASAVAAELGADAIGGPVGALSVSDFRSRKLRKARYDELIQTLVSIAETARIEGLRALLVEPTPCKRETPSTIEESLRFARDMQGSAVPVEFVLDIGHAVHHPVYGSDLTIEDWLAALAPYTGVFHLQNTDYQRDAHWGWPHDRGQVNVEETASAVVTFLGKDTPIFLELFHPFEQDDSSVLEDVRTSVSYCRERLQHPA